MILAWILPSRYSPEFHLSGARLDFYFFCTRPDSTFSGTCPIQPSRYSPRPFSSTRLDFYFSSTRSDSTFLVLARIQPLKYSPEFLLFWYSPGFYLFGTLLNSTFPILAQISTFFGTRPEYTFSRTRSDPTFLGTHPDPSPVLAWISTFPVLARILPSRYSPKFYLFGIRLDSTFSDTRPDPTFLVLTQTLLL